MPAISLTTTGKIMNVINNFSSSDVEARDTIITEYELDQHGKPVSKSISLVKGVEISRSQEHATLLSQGKDSPIPHQKATPFV
jgi:hypothetical protein